MSAKKEKPTEAELRELYEVQRLSARSIGMQFNVGNNTILRWLRAYGIDIRTSFGEYDAIDSEGNNIGNCLQNTKCPVTLERLKELYLIEMKSLVEIVNWIYLKLNIKVSDTSVRHWLHKDNILLRTQKHGRDLRGRKLPESLREKFAQSRIIAQTSPVRIEAVRKVAHKNMRKAQKASVLARKKRRVHLTCTNCGQQFSRPPAKAYIGKLPFCSNSCTGKYYTHQRKLARLAEPLRQLEAKKDAQAKEWLGDLHPEAKKD